MLQNDGELTVREERFLDLPQRNDFLLDRSMVRRRAEKVGNDLDDEVEREDDGDEATSAAVTPTGLTAAKHGFMDVPFRRGKSYSLDALFTLFFFLYPFRPTGRLGDHKCHWRIY